MRAVFAQNSHDEAVASDRLVLFGAWLSLVERLVRDQEVQSSNLCAPTIPLSRSNTAERGRGSDRQATS